MSFNVDEVSSAHNPGSSSEKKCAPLKDLIVYVINLDRSKDRLEWVDGQLKQQGLSYQRISAVDGRVATPSELAQLDEAKFRRCHGKLPLPGELGCYLSHVRVISEFLSSQGEFAVILEDDVILGEDFKNILAELVCCSRDWDMVKLSGVHSGTPIGIRQLDAKHELSVMLTKCTCSSAYIINRKAAKSYSEKLLPMYLPYDHEFDKGWHYGIKVRAVNPFPVSHNEVAASMISAVSENRKLPFCQRIPTHWYRIRVELKRVFCALNSLVAARK